MSPYLHFGMISPVYIYNEAMKRKATESRSQFIEELVVRRELSFNYCHYNPNYDRFEGLPAWAI
jgi:deoxyribodipyrimidine photo-lyase